MGLKTRSKTFWVTDNIKKFKQFSNVLSSKSIHFAYLLKLKKTM